MNKKKKNILSRIGAVILAIMCMLMPMSAFAEDATATTGTMPTIDTEKTGSITVHKYNLTEAKKDGVYKNWEATGEKNQEAETALEGYGIENVEFTYLKVADIKTQSADGNVGVVYSIKSELADILGLSKTECTSDEINNALDAKLRADSAGTKDKLAKYVQNGGNTIKTNANGVATASGLEVGLYLMVETSFPNNISDSVNPFFVSIPMTKADGSDWFYDVTVYPKNETDTATIDKLVHQNGDEKTGYADTANGSIGDKMDYMFVSRLPKISEDKNTYLKNYYFTDTASAGLTYNREEGVVIRFYNDEENAKKNNTTEAIDTWTLNDETKLFTVEYTNNSDGTTTMTVTPTVDGYAVINSKMSEKFMVVSYSATINDKAVLGDTGNPNKVILKWNRTPASDFEQGESTTTVYTFGLDLTKEFAGTNGDFSDVQFTLWNNTDGYYVVADGKDGVYTVTGKTTDKDKATKFVPSAEGKITINGIEADEYILTEVKTSEGYSLLKDPITINITKNGSNPATATVDGSTVKMNTVNGSANARVGLTVVNRSNFTLPITGGTGTILFTLCGCVLALVGIAIITGKKKTR